MTETALLWTAFAVLVACAGLGMLLLLRDRARLRHELDARHHDLQQLRARVEGLAVARAHRPEIQEFVITDLGPSGVVPREMGGSVGVSRTGSRGTIAPERIDGKLFADIVLRETMVKAAALTHGVRRALAPEVVWRVRGEVRRELKRARKQRRLDVKAARRAWAAREREADRLEGEAGAA